MSVRKEMKELLDALKLAGFEIYDGATHYKVHRGDGPSVTMGKSPSDRRAFANIRRDIRHVFNVDIRHYGWTK